jgi:hypothetical protein
MISKIKALSIAEKVIKAKQSETDYDDFSEITLNAETDNFWTFVSGSEKMFENGIIPGAFFVHIDKSNGHILSSSEESDFYKKSLKSMTRQIDKLQAA